MRGRHNTPSVSFSHFNNFLPPPFGTEFNIPGLRFGISVMAFDMLPVQCAHKSSNVRVYIRLAITNQKPSSSCLVLGVLVPRQWPQNRSRSQCAALWLPSTSHQSGWVKGRRLISPQRIIKNNLSSHSPTPLTLCGSAHLFTHAVNYSELKPSPICRDESQASPSQ